MNNIVNGVVSIDNIKHVEVADILGRDSKLITSKSLQFSSDKREGIIEINLPNEIQSQITRIEIDEHTNVGSIFLVDTSWYRRKVGIVADKNIFQTTPEKCFFLQVLSLI